MLEGKRKLYSIGMLFQKKRYVHKHTLQDQHFKQIFMCLSGGEMNSKGENK